MTRFNNFEYALFGKKGSYLKDSALRLESPKDEQHTNWVQRCKEVLLPELLEDPIQNRLRLAYVMTFVDSRKLPPNIRQPLGLPSTPDYSEIADLVEEPSFLDWEKVLWRWVCGQSSYYQKKAFFRTSGYPPSAGSSVGFEFARCMMGKSNRVPMGLCFNTTEFSNGSVFLKGIWYRLLGPGETLIQVGELNERSTFEGDFDWPAYLDTGIEPYLSNQLVVWENCGGIWAPTVNDDTVKIDYDGEFD